MAAAGKQDIIDFLTNAPKKGQSAAYETAAEAKRAVENTIEAIKSITSGKSSEGLTLVGFGAFKRVKRAARKGVNPQTKKTISIPAKKVVKFKAGKELKDMVAKGK